MENLRNQSAGNYDYDGNGNLTKDVSKDLVSITYDYRDLPTKIEFNLPATLVLDVVAPITGVRTYRALQTITAQNNFVVASGGDVTMQAGSKITLKPGFTAQSGSRFQAQMDPNIGIQPGNTISLTYNQAGERIAKNTETYGTLYYIRGVYGQTIALLDENDTPLFYNIAEVGRLAPGTNESSYYYLSAVKPQRPDHPDPGLSLHHPRLAGSNQQPEFYQRCFLDGPQLFSQRQHPQNILSGGWLLWR